MNKKQKKECRGGEIESSIDFLNLSKSMKLEIKGRSSDSKWFYGENIGEDRLYNMTEGWFIAKYIKQTGLVNDLTKCYARCYRCIVTLTKRTGIHFYRLFCLRTVRVSKRLSWKCRFDYYTSENLSYRQIWISGHRMLFSWAH